MIGNLKNKDLVKLQYSIFDTDPIIDIELSTFCNLKCVMCPRKKMTRKKGLMDKEIFNKVINFLPKNSRIMFSGLGEPLLNPNMIQYINQLKKKKMIVALTTNGILLTRRIIKALVNSRIDLLQISFNGIEKKTYESIMNGAKFSIIKRKFSHIKSLKKELDVKIAVVEQNLNKNELEGIKIFAQKNGFNIIINKIHSRGGVLNIFKPKSIPFNACGSFCKVMYISWDGSIYSCSNDFNGNNIIGHVSSNSFNSIIKIKKEIVKNENWFETCYYCNDEYRYLFLNNPRLFE